jgi:hypothetical protein
MAGRTIAIGDIHGCSAALRALLDAVARGAEVVVTIGGLRTPSVSSLTRTSRSFHPHISPRLPDKKH